MSDDINERIARLVEPEPVSSASSLNFSALGAWVSPNDYCRWEPVDFTYSVDRSLAVIERRWMGSTVLLSARSARLTTIPGLRTTKYTYRASDTTTSHAIAIALLAALEAEQ